MKSFIVKYVLIIITAIVIGVGVTLLPLSEADAERRWASCLYNGYVGFYLCGGGGRSSRGTSL